MMVGWEGSVERDPEMDRWTIRNAAGEIVVTETVPAGSPMPPLIAVCVDFLNENGLLDGDVPDNDHSRFSERLSDG